MCEADIAAGPSSQEPDEGPVQRSVTKKLAVFIPAYQAERTLARVVGRIPASVHEALAVILIQDDGSTDRTWEVMQTLASKDPKIVAVRHQVNLGYGGTNKAAFRWMRDFEVDAYVMLHGDLQYDPEYLWSMLGPIVEGKADIVLGSRISGQPLRGGMPLDRWLANRLLTWALNRTLGLQLTDYHTGYVAAGCDVLAKLGFDKFGDGHELSAELLVYAALARVRIAEVPVLTHYPREARSCSRLAGIRYSISVLRMVIEVSRLRRRGSSERVDERTGG